MELIYRVSIVCKAYLIVIFSANFTIVDGFFVIADCAKSIPDEVLFIGFNGF